MQLQKLGAFSFLAGILIAIIFGIIPSLTNLTWVAIVLMILGVLVGLLNVDDKNISLFLLAAISLVAMSTSLNAMPVIGGMLRSIIVNLVQFIGPAALIVSIVAIVRVSNSK
ncbi:MAG: hypothetical protein WCF78_03185 [archaeon]|jgi:putative exporter of polyketide antibiotics